MPVMTRYFLLLLQLVAVAAVVVHLVTQTAVMVVLVAVVVARLIPAVQGIHLQLHLRKVTTAVQVSEAAQITQQVVAGALVQQELMRHLIKAVLVAQVLHLACLVLQLPRAGVAVGVVILLALVVLVALEVVARGLRAMEVLFLALLTLAVAAVAVITGVLGLALAVQA